MRISDWSSDVCSSDLLYQFGGGGRDIVGKPGENPVLGRGPIVDARMGVARGGDLVRDRRLADQVQAPHLGRLDGDRMMMAGQVVRSEEHTSELQSLMRISYAVFCLKIKKK